jgi:hypothetical protein
MLIFNLDKKIPPGGGLITNDGTYLFLIYSFLCIDPLQTILSNLDYCTRDLYTIQTY